MGPRDKCSAATGDLTRNQKSKHFKWKKSKNYSQLDTATINRPSLIQTQTISIFILNQYLFGLSLRLLSKHSNSAVSPAKLTNTISRFIPHLYSRAGGEGWRSRNICYWVDGPINHRRNDCGEPERAVRYGRELRSCPALIISDCTDTKGDRTLVGQHTASTTRPHFHFQVSCLYPKLQCQRNPGPPSNRCNPIPPIPLRTGPKPEIAPKPVKFPSARSTQLKPARRNN